MVSMVSGSVILREPNKSDKDFSDTHLDVMGIGRIRISIKRFYGFVRDREVVLTME